MNDYWNELVVFTRSLFNSTFKTNPWLGRGIMTGITRVSKESIFSDLNHLEVVTTTSDKYATVFGFTEEEVFAALEECGLAEEKEKVKQWYDGFTFGQYRDIYNPWSILNFIDKQNYTAYWANTSGNNLAGKLLREANPEVKKQFEILIQGGTAAKAFRQNVSAAMVLFLKGRQCWLVTASKAERYKRQEIYISVGRSNYK